VTTSPRERRADATARAYATDWAIFGTWCDRTGREALPATPAVVCAFLQAQRRAGLAPATLRRRLAAIRARHLDRAYANPTDDESVRELVAAEAPAHGSPAPPARRKDPLTTDRLAAIIDAVPSDTPLGLRDRALLLLGFAAALRRSDLVQVRAERLEWHRDGVIVSLAGPRRGGRRAGPERRVPVARGRRLCPVQALRAWLDAAGIEAGPVFRSIAPGGALRETAMRPEMVTRKVKQYARAAGLPGRDVERLAGHSLRSGFVTAALANGADVFRVMEVTGHLSVQAVRGYLRSARPFYDHPGQGLL
jgi:site-specific recombinase XerD